MTPSAAQMIDACPIVNKRPRDLNSYRAAVAVTEPDRIAEHDAVEVQPGWSIWFFNAWRMVEVVLRHGGEVDIWLDTKDRAAWWCSGNTPVYRQLAG